MLEVRATDLGGRIGRLWTKRGKIEVPAILPVVHPWRQIVPCKDMKGMGFQAVMTNAYTSMKRFGEDLRSIHELIGFDGVVMTDSGGYQVLSYGRLDITPFEIMKFQEKIGSDIAVILDTPTGIRASKEEARKTVKETVKAAKESLDNATKEGILWSGPVQGGKHLDLVAYSAREMAKLPFSLFALGSPTKVMEAYDYNLLVDMISTAKRNLPLEKPLHLFGLGHPLTLPLAVALGCDLFDSASYALYAKEGRYISTTGTHKIERLEYFPCSCPVCNAMTPRELVSMDGSDIVRKLSLHNLYALLQELRTTKQAIRDGRLWDHLVAKARYHPKLWTAVAKLKESLDILEDGTPLFKPRAIYLCTPLDAERPEVKRHHERVAEIGPIKGMELLLLVPMEGEPLLEEVVAKLGLRGILKSHPHSARVCGVSYPWGLIPLELSLVYPLSQNLSSLEVDIQPLMAVVSRQLRSLMGVKGKERVRVMALDLGGMYSRFFAEISKKVPCKVLKGKMNEKVVKEIRLAMG